MGLKDVFQLLLGLILLQLGNRIPLNIASCGNISAFPNKKAPTALVVHGAFSSLNLIKHVGLSV